MRNSKFKIGLLISAVIVSISFGCSSSTGPTYPITLTLISTPSNPSKDTLLFQGTENGKALPGAALISTTNPYYIQTNLGIKSDSTGKFPPVIITINDSFAEVAYQAEIDSLVSNPIDWTWY